jgi:hypothetical protein
MRTYTRRWLALACVAVVLWGGACSSSGGSSTEGSADTTESTQAPTADQRAPAQTVYTTSAGQVTLACEGSGPMPVILLAGGVDPITTWDDLVPRIGSDVLVCRFDPLVPGPPSTPITATNRSNGLAEALSASGLTGPYLLVGHSLAGLTIRQFGADHPEMLGAALLLDPTIARSVEGGGVNLAALNWDADAALAEMHAPVTWPDVPLLVLSHDPNLLTLGAPAVEQVWTEGQEGYTALSPQGKQAAVPEASHYIYRDAPDRVATSVRELIDRSRCSPNC